MGAFLSSVSEPLRRWPRRQTDQPPSPADPVEPNPPPTPSLRETTGRSDRRTDTSSPSPLDQPSPKSNPTGSDSGAPVSPTSDVQVSLPTGPDVKQFESSGRATGWAETMPIRPQAARRPRRRLTKTRPQAVAGGFNPSETPGQAPFPSAPSAQYRRRSVSAAPDEALESKRHSRVKQSAPDDSLPASPDLDIKVPDPSNNSALQIRPRLEIDELWDNLSSPTRESLKRLDGLDRSGQLTERTGTKFTGGFSDVSQAKLGGRVVAVKALRVANIEGAESQRWKRLARELYVWGALDHPNVLELLGFAFEDGGPCLISPWCDYGTLQEYLQKFPDANRRRLVCEIAEGLRYLHEQTPPIIHGDLKTTNVFVTGDHVAKISDFGTSRHVEGLRTGFTTNGLVLATIRYTASEILRDGQHPTLPSDVFSFGCVALETMTDKLPFWKIHNVVQVITEVVFQRQTPSPEDHPGVEEAIWELLRRCWNYEPSDRPHMIEVCQTLSGAGYGSSAGFYLPPRAGPSNTFYSPTRGSIL